jgi:hypothetical protein
MADNFDFTATGELLERDGTDTAPVYAARVKTAKINDAIVADVDAVMREARAPRHQVIAVSELVLPCHAGSSPGTASKAAAVSGQGLKARTFNGVSDGI